MNSDETTNTGRTASHNAANPSLSVDDRDKHTRHVGYITIAIFFCLTVVWSTFAPLESAVLAPGIVQVEGKRKAVQHYEGGIVSDLLVTNGEWVEENQALAVLDATAPRSELRIIEGRLYGLLALQDRLYAERDGTDEITFSQRLIDAASSDDRAETAMLGEQVLFTVRAKDRAGEVSVLEQQIAESRERKKGLSLILESHLSVLASLDEEIGDLLVLLDEGYVDKQRVRELQRAKNTTLAEIADVRANIASLEISIGETQLKILQFDKRFKTEIVSEIKETQRELYDRQQQHSTVSDRVQRATLRAPVAGAILGLNKSTIGAVVSPGEKLMEVVPDISSLMVEARVSPMDIDRVTLGQEAEIRFAVFKDAYLVSGSLSNLSPDRLIDQDTGIPFYAAEVSILKDDIKLLGGTKLVPGMPAEVLIKTGSRTMLGYLTSPLRRGLSKSLIED